MCYFCVTKSKVENSCVMLACKQMLFNFATVRNEEVVRQDGFRILAANCVAICL